MDKGNKLDVELNAEVAKGSYSNLSIITHSSNEFILDFLRMLPGIPKASVGSRIIMTPENAKRLSKALDDNIAKFENQFGEITLHDMGPVAPDVPMGFTPPAAKS